MFVMYNMLPVGLQTMYLVASHMRTIKGFLLMFSLCSLDTFPYAGTTTTCESLYMGVPCVTMAGSVHAHNVGVSLLSKVGENHFPFPFG